MTPKKLLIIDDDPMLLEALSDNFTDEGFVVHASADAEDAFTYMKEEVPDVILTDLVMQQVDGFEILRVVNESLHLRDVPVIVMSNRAEDGDVAKAMKLGAVHFLIKAEHSLGELVDEVMTALQK